MVKSPDMVEGNIEICCCKLLPQMHKNKHKMHKIPIFILFHNLAKISMSTLEQYSKILMSIDELGKVMLI